MSDAASETTNVNDDRGGRPVTNTSAAIVEKAGGLVEKPRKENSWKKKRSRSVKSSKKKGEDKEPESRSRGVANWTKKNRNWHFRYDRGGVRRRLTQECDTSSTEGTTGERRYIRRTGTAKAITRVPTTVEEGLTIVIGATIPNLEPEAISSERRKVALGGGYKEIESPRGKLSRSDSEGGRMEGPSALTEKLRDLKRRQIAAIREIEEFNQQRLIIDGLESRVQVLEEHARLLRQAALPIEMRNEDEIKLIERGNKAVSMSARLRGESTHIGRTANVIDPESEAITAQISFAARRASSNTNDQHRLIIEWANDSTKAYVEAYPEGEEERKRKMKLKDIKEIGWTAQTEGSTSEKEQGADKEKGSREEKEEKKTKKIRKVQAPEKPPRKATAKKMKTKHGISKRKKKEKLKEDD